MEKIYPGELVVIEYVDGSFVNRWAVNTSKEPIEIAEGRKVDDGFTDVLAKKDDAELIDSRFHVVGDASALKFVTEDGFRTQEFAQIPLAVLKVVNETAIYDRFGTQIGTIPAGTEVGTDEGDAGNSMRHLMVANAFNDGSGWKFMNQTTYSYGFFNVQQGFSLEMYNGERSVVTQFSEREFDPDWSWVESVIDTNEPEMFLRGDLTNETKETIVENVQSLFAVKDLANAHLGDPSEFFMNENNRQFVIRELAKVDQTRADEFETESENFTNK